MPVIASAARQSMRLWTTVDRFVPRDDAIPVIVSCAMPVLAMTPCPSLRAQRGNPCVCGPLWIASCFAMTPFLSLRAAAMPVIASAARQSMRLWTTVDRFVPRDDAIPVIVSCAMPVMTPFPSSR
jgi:hypothetical protein